MAAPLLGACRLDDFRVEREFCAEDGEHPARPAANGISAHVGRVVRGHLDAVGGEARHPGIGVAGVECGDVGVA